MLGSVVEHAAGSFHKDVDGSMLRDYSIDFRYPLTAKPCTLPFSFLHGCLAQFGPLRTVGVNREESFPFPS